MNYGCDSSFVIHVSKSGNDSNGGVAQQYPVSLANDSKLTIGSALSTCPDGGTIVIWPGTYTEQVDLQTATKTVNLIGTQREKCIISQNTVNPAVLLYAGSLMRNLRVTQAGAGMVVNGSGQDNCQVINCSIVGGDSTIDGLYFTSAKRCLVRGCYIKSGYDSLYAGISALVEDSIIITNGLAGGSGVARAIAIADTSQRTIIRNCIIIAQPSYEKAIGKSPELYQSNRDLYCIHGGGDVVLDNCILIADGYKPTGAHANSYSNGHSYCTALQAKLVAKNCTFKAYTDQNVADRVAYGITSDAASLINCIIGTSATGSGGVAWDIQHGTGSTVCLVAIKYDPDKVHSNVTLKSDVDNALSDARLDQAAKMLLNKAIQSKATGVIDYYDDDGETKILTHTPTDGESTITRVPS